MKILVVDDNHDAADSLARALQIEGHKAASVYGGLECLAYVQEKAVDVVILDIGMPRLTGYDVCKQLRRQPCGIPSLHIAASIE